MKKLLFFASDYKIGLSALLTDQLQAIVRAGIDVVAVAGECEQEKGLSASLSDSKVDLIRINGLDEHSDFGRLTSKLASIIVSNKIDIVHVQNNWQLALMGYVKTKLLFKRNIKIAYTLHGFRHNSPVKSRIAQGVIGSALFAFADKVICMTEYLRGKFSALSYKIEIIPLGVKDDYHLSEFRMPDVECLRLVFPAQFREGKNQDVIIRAFKRYVEATNDNDSELVLPGSGPKLDEMKHLAKSLGIGGQIHFPGQMSKDEVKKLYLDSNIAIVSSNSETFGQSIVEPFVLGRCVISTPVGIAPEIITQGDNGFLFETESQLTDILLKCGRNKHLLLESGCLNFKQGNMFKWDRIIDSYKDKILS